MRQFSQYLRKHGFEAFKPRAVLFDMDGVLYDSMPHHAIAWQQSMAKFGVTMTADDAYATEGARGIDTIRNMVKAQQGRDISEAEAQRMYDLKSRLFHEMDEAPIMDGIPELLARVAESGVSMGVVTGSGQRPLFERLVRDFGQYISPDHIVTAYDVERGKPCPDPYLKGLEKMGNLQPWQAIVVENAPLGIRAGVAARIFTIGVNTGPLSDDVLRAADPDLLFANMHELKDSWGRIVYDKARQGLTSRWDQKWEQNYNDYLQFMKDNGRRPSKYHSDEMKLVNWLKSNRKQINKKTLSLDRETRIYDLLAIAELYYRPNQYCAPLYKEFGLEID